MKKPSKKRVLSLLVALCLIISILSPFSTAAGAEGTTADKSDDSSMDIAEGWGFDTSQPETSQARAATGENPIGANTDAVTIFGEAPLEIAVVGSRVFASAGGHYRTHDDEERGDIYWYDGAYAYPDPVSDLFYKNSGKYGTVAHITFPDEPDVRPAKTIAADINGDGVDEIIRYYIEINYNGSEGKPDGDIDNFNAGVEGYSADFNLQCINSQTGQSMGKTTLRTVSKADIHDFYIPDSIYYWSSYLQITAGDYDGDGKEEVAVAVPGQLRESGNSQTSGNIYIFGVSPGPVGVRFDLEYVYDDLNYCSLYGDTFREYTAFHLASGDVDNDNIDELVYTYTGDVLTVDQNSSIRIIDYQDGSYSSISRTIAFGNKKHPVGNAGVTVGDIDNDGLNEIVVGGYMVNKNDQGALYAFTNKFGKTEKFEYYHELAMSYMKYDQESGSYGDFEGFTVFREEEDMAWTRAGDTSYNSASGRDLASSARYRNARNWTLPLQSVSLTGYVNGRTNHQIFFGNCMYYYDVDSGKFNIYDDEGKANDSIVPYKNFSAPNSSINALIPGSFLDQNDYYVKSEGREQLLVSYAFDCIFEFALMYESAAGTSLDVQKKYGSMARAASNNPKRFDFYPTVCAPNMDNDAIFVQYIDYAFTYSKPEVLSVLASIPYYEDIYNAYPWPDWEPGSTYLGKSSGSSQTATGVTEFSLGGYVSIEQDISVLGLKIASIEMENSISANTSYEFSHTIERESTVQYETNGGQDSVVMVSAPLDVYYYRYYEESIPYKGKYPDAKKSDPSTWGIMAVSIPSAPQIMVFPVESYNDLAEISGLDKIDSDFWIHTQGDPGTYPKSVAQFKGAENVLSSDSSISATFGSGSVSTELTITESDEHAFTFSLSMESRVGAGVGGGVLGIIFGGSIGAGGAVASFSGTTIGSSLANFPTTGYSLTTRLHSYTTVFNDEDIMVLYYTVSNVQGLPKLPSSFYVEERTTDRITLAWDVPDNISDGLKPNRYELYRYDNYFKEWALLDDNISIEAGTNYYLDTDVFPNVTYKYKLVALDSTGIKTNSVTLEASTAATGDPPVITAQPRDTTAAAGDDASFSIDAKLPEGAAPARLYYQWYQRQSPDDNWSAIPGANEKTLTLSSVTPAMDGFEYCCMVTRLMNNQFPLSAESAYARLSVTEQSPEQYTVSYFAGINGSVTAFEIGAGGNYEIKSGDKVSERTTVEFIAKPDLGYRVSRWTINGEAALGNTGNTLTIDSLSGDVTVNVSFTYSTYDITFDIAENTEEGQNGAVWGTLTARYAGSFELPQGEATSVAAQMPITFTAVPAVGGDTKYTVKQWSKNGEVVKNDNGSTFIGDTYTIEALSEHTVVKVMFARAVDHKVEVSSQITNTDVAYFDNGIIIIRADGDMVLPSDPIKKGSRVTIDVTPPHAALIYSWEITAVDDDGKPAAPPTVLGSQPSYTINELSASYRIEITYVVVSTKTVTFGSEGGSGTVTAVVGVGNTSPTGVVESGGKVQMYSDIVFTAHPELGVKGWTVNNIYLARTDTSYTLEDINRNTTVKVLFESAPTAKDFIGAVEIKAGETEWIDADTVALDADGDSLAVSRISTKPDEKIAIAGIDDGKATITGVNRGITGVVLTVSDGKGHTCDVPVGIIVSNNPQSQPLGLEGIAPTSEDGSDGKIKGLKKGKTYQYKAAGEEGYSSEIDGQDGEITGLAAGTYLVRYAAVPGYDASKATEVEVPQYIPKSTADLETLNYKVGEAEEEKVPGFDKNTVTYQVVLDSDVEEGTEIVLSGRPAAGSGATVTETVSGTLQDGFATARIKVTAQDQVTNKTYTVNFTTFEAVETPAVTPATASFDKYDDTEDDRLNKRTISFTVDSSDYEFTAITGMTEDTDYSLEDNGTTITIHNNTLHNLQNGVHYLAFVFTGEKICTVALEIEDGRPLVTGVFVSPATAAVTQGRTKAFTATLSGINHGNSVKWSVSGSECENTSISAAGVLTVDTAEAAGTVLTVRAVSTVDPTKFGTASVMVVGRVDAQTPVFELDLSADTVLYNVGEIAAPLSVKAVVSDGGTISYKWYENNENSAENGTEIAGANSESYTPSTGTAGIKYYYVIATNDNPDATGSTTAAETSAVTPVQVKEPVHAEPPKITGLTGKTSYLQGDTISSDDWLIVSATVDDEGTISYRWYSKASDEGGSDTLVSENDCCIPSTNVAGTFSYYVVVTNTNNNEWITGNTTASVTSDDIVVTVEAVVNAAQPYFMEGGNLSGSANYPVGGSVAPLTVTAAAADLGSGGVLSYQWYMNDKESAEGGAKVGANSASYTPAISGLPAGTTLYFYVVVTNTNESVNGAKTASIVSGIKTIKIQDKVDAAEPVFEDQSKGTWIYYKGAKSSYLEVYATSGDGGVISYQWYKNSENNNTTGVAIEGATGRTYTPSTDETGTTYYYVVAVNTNTEVNGNQTASKASAVITIHVVQPVLISLGEIDASITGIPYGTAASASALGLPVEIPINISIDGIPAAGTAAITWDLSGYKTSKTSAQTFIAAGTVILPTGVVNTDNIPLKVAVSVSVAAKPPEGGGGSGGGGGGKGTPLAKPSAETPIIEITTADRTTTAIATIPAATGSDGKTTATITQALISNAVNQAVSEARKQGDGTKAAVRINIETEAGANTVEAAISESSLTLMAEGGIEKFTVSNPIASITFSNKVLSAISGEAAGDVKISASRVDSLTLSDELKQMVGDRPVFDFSVRSADKTISQFGENVSVSVPYTPKAGEDTNAIVIYFISAEGRPEIVSNCAYDPKTETITFKTDHFTKYAVGYNRVTFNDVAANAWYGEAVCFAAARGITKGTGDGNFHPEGKLTRGQLLVMVMRAYGISPDENPKDNFSDAGNTYYTGYLATAKRLGISGGVGNNMYAPDKEITRQEMFTLLYNTLKLIGELPQSRDGKKLNDFNDSGQIADWAKEAMRLFVEAGTISGSGGMLSPANTTTRAEMAQTLYKLLSS